VRGRVVGLLPVGTQITLDAASDGNWHKVKRIVEGNAVLAPGWVFEPELEATRRISGLVRYQVKEAVSDIEEEIAGQMKGLRMRLAPNGEVMGLLPAGAVLSLGERQGNWAKVIDLDHSAEAKRTAHVPVYKKGWVWLAELEKLASASEYYRVGNRAHDVATSRADGHAVTGINLRLEPNGFLLGLLPRGSALELGRRENQWVQIKTIHEGKPVYNLAWVWVRVFLLSLYFNNLSITCQYNWTSHGLFGINRF